mgnify:CR=1 FL=1
MDIKKIGEKKALENLACAVFNSPYWGNLYLNEEKEVRFGSFIYKARPFLENGNLNVSISLYLYGDYKYVDIFTIYTSHDYFEFLISEENKKYEFLYDTFLESIEKNLEEYYGEKSKEF